LLKKILDAVLELKVSVNIVQRNLNNLQNRSISNVLPTLHTEFPLQEEKDLNDVEEKLTDEDKYKTMVIFLLLFQFVEIHLFSAISSIHGHSSKPDGTDTCYNMHTYCIS